MNQPADRFSSSNCVMFRSTKRSPDFVKFNATFESPGDMKFLFLSLMINSELQDYLVPPALELLGVNRANKLSFRELLCGLNQ